MAGETIIQTKNLSKRYPASDGFALRNISLEIKAGEKFGILGPNGAGKTTLLSIICGIIPHSGGTLAFYKDSQQLPLSIVQKHLGLVPQDFALYDELSPKQNLQYFGSLYGLSHRQIRSRTERLLSLTGLATVADKKVQFFSGGMKRRLNLAIALIHDPDILFLDEPTVGVDAQSRHAIMAFLNELNSKGTTIVYTSHHLSEVQDFCETIAIIDHGRIVANNSLQQLLVENNAESLHQLFIQLTGEECRNHV